MKTLRRFIRFIAPFHCFGEVFVEENTCVHPKLLCSCKIRASFPLTDTARERRELKGGGYRDGDRVDMETDTGKKIPFVVVDNIVYLDTWRQEIVLEADDVPEEDAKWGESLPTLRPAGPYPGRA